MACSEEHAAELEEETRLVERGLLMEEEQDCFEEDECPGCSRCRLAEFRRNSNVMLWETL